MTSYGVEDLVNTGLDLSRDFYMEMEIPRFNDT